MKQQRALRGKTGLWLLIASGVLTVGICLAMNLFLLPAIEKSTGGIRCFDMNFAYSFETAQQFLARLSEEGRSLYLTRQLPLDFFYPLAYGAFFALLLYRLQDKATAALLLPALLMALDYGENLCIIAMLRAEPLTKGLACTGSVLTSLKTAVMYAVILLCAVLIFRRLRAKRKKENA